MSRTTRMGGAVIALALASAATPALAQIPGMPLFTNPRYGTGFRIHADFGKPTEDAPDSSDLSVYQAGVSFALGPLGIGANIGQSKTNFDRNQVCRTNPNADCLEERVTASALVQLRVAGGGRSNLSLSAFGGASVDVSVDTAQATATASKVMNIPVGVAVGLRVPLGVASLNLWGAPRYNFTRISDCSAPCEQPDPVFGWAVGADFPIFRIISIRAAYDSHKDKLSDRTVSVIGFGASIGIGGMR